MTQQMFSFAVPVRSICRVYDNQPLPVHSAHSNLLNAYRCAYEDMSKIHNDLAMWKRRLGLANQGQWGKVAKVATKAEIRAAKSQCMTMLNKLRACQRKQLAILAAAFDAITPDEAATIRNRFDA